MKRKVICRCCGLAFVPDKPLQTCCAKCWDDDDSGVVISGPVDEQQEQKGETP
jgi:hypothetical protein